MNLKKSIATGEINEALNYIKLNYTEMYSLEFNNDPLSISLKNNCSVISQFLIESGFHTYCNHEKQLHYLQCAASGNSTYELLRLLKDITFTQKELNKILFNAVTHCSVLTAIIIIEAGAKISHDHFKLIINALDYENTEVAIFLIHQLNNINIIDKNGFSLLHHVTAVGRDKVLLDYLLHKDLDVNLKNHKGHTALILSLLSIELDFDNSFFEFAIELVKAGADVNIQDIEGNTVLMYACMYYNYTIEGHKYIADYLHFLVENGADVNLTNLQNKTALDIAEENNFQEGVAYLRKLPKSELVIPNTDVQENNNATPNIKNYQETSILGEKGYSTKYNREKRWNILTNQVLIDNPPQNVINLMSEFIRRYKAQRNGTKKYANAIAKWEYDIQRIKKYYSE